LVQTSRIWDIAKQKSTSLNKIAVLFWQNTMYCKADIVVTPRPLHVNNDMIMWCYSKPAGYYDDELRVKFGEFNLATYWGPFASPKSSEWITHATIYTLKKYAPGLTLTYIPHIDYSAQRFGKNSTEVKHDLKIADQLVGDILTAAQEMGTMENTQFIVLSEYGFNDVTSSIPLNLKLRDSGLLLTRKIQSKEYIDYELSRAFAMVDHQIAHIYIKEDSVHDTLRVLEDTEGIDMILANEHDKSRLNINNQRSGNIIAIADRDKWFNYYWWYDMEKAPGFVKTVDIHRKPGYDPVELFVDRDTGSIPLDTSLVKSSHGRPMDPKTGEGAGFYASNYRSDIERRNDNYIDCIDVGRYLIKTTSYL
jgi:predicted AlkP superfamily pyrophosphatase or phosphodiesterase